MNKISMTASQKSAVYDTITKQIVPSMLLWTLRLSVLLCFYAITWTVAVAESYCDNRSFNHTFSVVDVGFTMTQSLHQYLRMHQSLHHYLACLNSLGMNMLMSYTVIGIGYYHGRPGITVLVGGIFLMRLACGWLTQLPYASEYLASDLDFPDCLINLFHSSASRFHQRQHSNFIYFFSGHVALASLVSTYLRQTGRRHLSYACSLFNILQMIRLVATRGHYTIDLIGGVFVGTYAYSFMEPVDKYMMTGPFFSSIVRRQNMKLE